MTLAPHIRRAVLALALCAPAAAPAQMKQTFTIQNGKVQGAATAAQKSGGIRIPEEQKLAFDAAGKAVEGNFKAAEALYSRAIAINGGDGNLYLQRALMRRELNDARGATADAQRAIRLADMELQRRPSDAELYYQRSLGNRLLKRFDDAERDLIAAIRIDGRANWENDLKALRLEKKMANSR